MGMGRNIIIGDVHGMREELEELLATVAPTHADHVISVGDLMDKGPDCAGAVRVLRVLRESGVRVTLVRGNHEERHERFRRNEDIAARTGRPNPMSRLDVMHAAMRGMTAADISFLETAVPLVHLPHGQGVVVHGGVLPTHTALPEDFSGLSRREREHLEKIYRVRHVSPTGSMVPVGDETDEDRYWAEIYDGRFGRVWFGHTAFYRATAPVPFPHAIGLDLGAVYGNYLAAAILSGEDEPQWCLVRAHAAFAEPHDSE